MLAVGSVVLGMQERSKQDVQVILCCFLRSRRRNGGDIAATLRGCCALPLRLLALVAGIYKHTLDKFRYLLLMVAGCDMQFERELLIFTLIGLLLGGPVGQIIM